MSYQKSIQQINKKKILPIILLYGLEPFFIQNIKNALISVILNDNEENVITYDLEEVPIEDVITDAETFPFFGDRKLIIAYQPQFLQTNAKKLPFEHNLKRLEQYIEQPVDYSFILFIAPYEKLDNRKKIMKLIKKHAMVVECNPIKEQEINKWIKDLANNLQIKVDQDVYDVFEAEGFQNLFQIQNELMKLAMYVGEKGKITREIAEDLISQSINSSALRLVDAVIERNLHKAISIYKNLEKMNEEPIALIALLAFQYRIIYQVKLLRKKGYSPFQMQKQIGAHPYVIKMANDRENRFTFQKLNCIFEYLTKADTDIKQGRMEKGLAFELLLYQLIQSK